MTTSTAVAETCVFDVAEMVAAVYTAAARRHQAVRTCGSACAAAVADEADAHVAYLLAAAAGAPVEELAAAYEVHVAARVRLDAATRPEARPWPAAATVPTGGAR